MLLFDPTTAVLAALLWLAAPGAVAVGHETLSDSLSLGLFAWTLALAVQFWQGARRVRRSVLACARVLATGHARRPSSCRWRLGLAVVRAASSKAGQLDLPALNRRDEPAGPCS